MNFSSGFDRASFTGKIYDKDQIIRERDAYIRHLNRLIKFKDAELDDYKNFISTVEDQNIILEQKNSTIDKLNEYKIILSKEIEEKNEECARNEDKIKKLMVENEYLTAWNASIIEEYENYKSSLELKPSFDETLEDIHNSHIFSDGNTSLYEIRSKYDELLEILTNKDNEIRDLIDEVKFLRHEKSRMSSELSVLRDQIEGYNNDFNFSILLQPSLERISLADFINLNEDQSKFPRIETNVAIEIPETFQNIDRVSNVEEEYCKAKVEDLEKQLLECKQKLHETIENMKSHQCRVICNNDIEEDSTQSSTEKSIHDDYFVSVEEIRRIHEEEIETLEAIIEQLKTKILSSNKKESDGKKDRRNPFAIIFDYILSSIKSSLTSIIKKLKYLK